MFSSSLLAVSKYLPVLFVLVKVLIILKYFLFIKYRTSAWRAVHFVYFPSSHIGMQEYDNSHNIKRMQNHLTILFVVCNLALMYVKSMQ